MLYMYVLSLYRNLKNLYTYYLKYKYIYINTIHITFDINIMLYRYKNSVNFKDILWQIKNYIIPNSKKNGQKKNSAGIHSVNLKF